MTRKSMNQKIQERFKQIQTDRLHEEKVTRFDERRDAIHEAQKEAE